MTLTLNNSFCYTRFRLIIYMATCVQTKHAKFDRTKNLVSSVS